ncbi:MAG: co-chaperone GroES, partial [Campylobacterales bacterium]|nr:co-chaperone GroES [Campylobacterales bacterium]
VAVSKKLEDKGEVKCGDTVLFGKYAGTEISVEGKEYLVMSIDDILGVM